MTPSNLKALLATIERGYIVVEREATMDSDAWDSFEEGRQATAALLQNVERMEIDNQRLRKLCEKAADTLDYEARPAAYTSKGKQMYKSTKKVYDELRTEALSAGGQPDTLILDNQEAYVTWVDNDEGRLAIWLQPNAEAFKQLRGLEHESVRVTIAKVAVDKQPDTGANGA